MDYQLRKAYHIKSMLRNKYFKCGPTQLQLKTKSMADYCWDVVLNFSKEIPQNFGILLSHL